MQEGREKHISGLRGEPGMVAESGTEGNTQWAAETLPDDGIVRRPAGVRALVCPHPGLQIPKRTQEGALGLVPASTESSEPCVQRASRGDPEDVPILSL